MAEVSDNNVYQNGRVIVFDDGTRMLVREPVDHETTREDRVYTIRRGDLLTVIAWKHYRGLVRDASKYWWVIADANEIQNPADLSDMVGQEIVVPNILNIKLNV